MKAFILSVIAVLCASTELRGGVEIEHLTDARARGIVKVWWDENARKQFLERLSLGESNFVAVCVGDTKLVCSMPAGRADDASARSRIDVMRRHHDMDRDIRRHDFERDEDSKWLTEEASNAFNRAQCERDALVRLVDVGSQKTAKEWSDLRRKEESARLERLLDRFSRNEGTMFRGKGENTRRAWEEVYAEMRKRGVSETNIELMRHNRELRDAHHREFMPHERMDRNRMLREEVREFERWLEMRVSEDRRYMREHVGHLSHRPKQFVCNEDRSRQRKKMFGNISTVVGVGMSVLVLLFTFLVLHWNNSGKCKKWTMDGRHEARELILEDETIVFPPDVSTVFDDNRIVYRYSSCFVFVLGVIFEIWLCWFIIFCVIDLSFPEMLKQIFTVSGIIFILLFGGCAVAIACALWHVGRHELLLYQDHGVYRVGFFPFVREQMFPFLPARIETTGQKDRVREIRVSNIRFGSSLPDNVLDFYCEVIQRRVAGKSDVQLKIHDRYWLYAKWIGGVVLIAANLFSQVYSFSKMEQIRVDSGMLTVIRYTWWGKYEVIEKTVPVDSIKICPRIGERRVGGKWKRREWFTYGEIYHNNWSIKIPEEWMNELLDVVGSRSNKPFAHKRHVHVVEWPGLMLFLDLLAGVILLNGNKKRLWKR